MNEPKHSAHELTLYHFGNSVCSAKVRVALCEKSLSWEDVHVDIMAGKQFEPAYLKLNPKAVVPTLVHKDIAVTESTLIVEYLDDAFPDPAFRPSDPAELALARQFPKLCDEGLHQGTAVLTGAAMFVDRLRARSAEDASAFLRRIVDLERRDRQTALYERGLEAPHVYRGVVAFEKAFAKIDKVLSDGRTWLAGEQFSIAEINLCPYVARLEYLGLLKIWTRHCKHIEPWYLRMTQRRSFQQEVAARIDADERRRMLEGGRKVELRVAEIRDDYLSTDSGAGLF
jgi:glutathione S-transferase